MLPAVVGGLILLVGLILVDLVWPLDQVPAEDLPTVRWPYCAQEWEEWAHNADSCAQLAEALRGSTSKIQVNVRLGPHDKPVVATGDLSLAKLCRLVAKHNMARARCRGVGTSISVVKLVLQDPAAAIPVLRMIGLRWKASKCEVWIHADILPGPGRRRTAPISGYQLMWQYRLHRPRHVATRLSLGWTPSPAWLPPGFIGLRPDVVTQMLRIVDCDGDVDLIISMRVDHALASLRQVDRVLKSGCAVMLSGQANADMWSLCRYLYNGNRMHLDLRGPPPWAVNISFWLAQTFRFLPRYQ